jgi:hypothetical protein
VHRWTFESTIFDSLNLGQEILIHLLNLLDWRLNIYLHWASRPKHTLLF